MSAAVSIAEDGAIVGDTAAPVTAPSARLRRPPPPAPVAAAAQAPVVSFDDARVQRVYEILCSDEQPPAEQHWEGWTARRIVDALRRMRATP